MILRSNDACRSIRTRPSGPQEQQFCHSPLTLHQMGMPATSGIYTCYCCRLDSLGQMSWRPAP